MMKIRGSDIRLLFKILVNKRTMNLILTSGCLNPSMIKLLHSSLKLGRYIGTSKVLRITILLKLSGMLEGQVRNRWKKFLLPNCITTLGI